MKFDLLKTRSPKPEQEALLLIGVIETPILCPWVLSLQ
jgi:hypothetical protein